MEEDSLEMVLLYFGLGTIIGILLVIIAVICIRMIKEECGLLSLDDSGDEGAESQIAIDEPYRQQVLNDHEFRQSYEVGLAFETQYPYGSLNTQMTQEQETLIQEKGVNAWEFYFDSELNGLVQNKTDVMLYGGDNIIQTNIPIPSTNSTYYFETKITDIAEATNLYVGIATKPYPVWRMVGFNKFSIGYNTKTGYVYNSSVFRRVKHGAKINVGDIIGVGYNTHSGCTWFTFNGKRLAGFFYGMKYTVFPSVSADGPCSFSVNFGQRGFVFIEANVKKWGLAPLEGNLKPPPQYGVTEGSVFLEAGETSRCHSCAANVPSGSWHNNESANNAVGSSIGLDDCSGGHCNQMQVSSGSAPNSHTTNNDTHHLINGGGAGTFFGPYINHETLNSTRSIYPLEQCIHSNMSNQYRGNGHTVAHIPPGYQEQDPIALQIHEARSSSIMSKMLEESSGIVNGSKTVDYPAILGRPGTSQQRSFGAVGVRESDALITSQLLEATCQLVSSQAAINSAEIYKNLTILKLFVALNSSNITLDDTDLINLNITILELGAEFELSNKNISSFEDYMAKLFFYYFDFKNQLNEPPKRNYFIGLYLLALLCQNRISDFHVVLERLEYNVIQSDVYVMHPIKVEQALMEGSYKKVYIARAQVPAPAFENLVDLLLSTIRDEIAKCASQSYVSLPINDAKTLLFCNDYEQLSEIAKSNNWTINPYDKKVYFVNTNEESFDFDPQLVISQSLTFAQELERIV
ncbi:hypothetical protein BB561_004432 [Smittium simulii]|uniref:B30.2/SPRY domain-containing protein n=1 Tax=Smittium simulii TaxID=133385 RepID=A0A2T9YGB7_9FUNG|nr:hypothetical protein BB561_004432 [Smittium simulii]